MISAMTGQKVGPKWVKWKGNQEGPYLWGRGCVFKEITELSLIWLSRVGGPKLTLKFWTETEAGTIFREETVFGFREAERG